MLILSYSFVKRSYRLSSQTSRSLLFFWLILFYIVILLIFHHLFIYLLTVLKMKPLSVSVYLSTLVIISSYICMLYIILTTLYSYLLVQMVNIWLWLCDICPAREEEKLKMEKQNEALTAERKRLDQRAAQLAESLSVSDHCYPMSQCL